VEAVTGVSIVIPTLGNHAVLFETLDSLRRHGGNSAEVLVVCNAPEAAAEALGKEVSARHPEVRTLVTPRPYGIAQACNVGWRAARGDKVVFMHDDVLLRDDAWLGRLSEVLDHRPDVGMVGGSEGKFLDRTPETATGSWQDARECDWSPTISMTRKSCLADGCLFDEKYEVGLEDKDWALSFRRRGLKVFFRPVDHVHVGTRGSYTLFLENKALLDYYTREGVRERYFLAKNRDVLAPAYVARGLAKWGRRDRDWGKTWWVKLYLRYYLRRVLRGFV
jgi:glycosyltransferase involved in cell wall biosynthesis